MFFLWRGLRPLNGVRCCAVFMDKPEVNLRLVVLWRQ